MQMISKYDTERSFSQLQSIIEHLEVRVPTAMPSAVARGLEVNSLTEEIAARGAESAGGGSGGAGR